MDIEGLGDSTAALAGLEPFDGFLPLVIV